MQNIVNTSQEFKAIFNRASVILSACVLRADMLRSKADKVKRSNNTSTWIKNMRIKDDLIRAADRTEARGRKVWECVTSFQGKYVNWRNLTTDNVSIHDLHLRTSDSYTANLPIVKKLAGIN